MESRRRQRDPGRRRLRWIAAGTAAGLGLLGVLFLLFESPSRRLERFRGQLAAEGGELFIATLRGRRQAFVLQHCRLDRVDLSRRRLRRERVLEPDFYPFAFCMQQSIRQRRGVLEVELQMRALGSGGGNQGGGTWRSADGVHWSRL